MAGGRLVRRWNGCAHVPQHGPDSVHSWLIAGACALACFFAMAGRRSAGFLFVAILDTFQVNRSEGSWPIMLMGGLVYLAGLITGPLAHRFNARPVIIAGAVISGIGAMLSFFADSIAVMTVTLGAIHAIGAGMVFVVSPTIISEHFVKHKGLAMGINFTGVTMGTFVFPKLLEYLAKTYGLRGALLIFGAIVMNGLAFSLFPRTPKWRSAPPEQKLANAQASQTTSSGDKNHGTLRHGLTVFKHPIFYLVMYSFIVHSFGFECYISLFVDFAVDRGVAVSSAVTMVSMGAIAEALGRLTLPAAVDRGWLTNKQLIVLIFAVQGGMFIILPFLYIHGLIFTVAAIIAYTIGTGLVLFPVILAIYLGQERMSMSYGMVIASAGLLSFIKPSVIGYFRDNVGAYDVLFVICGSLIAFAAIMWILVFMWEARERKKDIVGKGGSLEGAEAATKMYDNDLNYQVAKTHSVIVKDEKN